MHSNLGLDVALKIAFAHTLRVISSYILITDSVMRFNLSFLVAITVMAASGITFAQSSGTAFVVAPGLLVTNHHVIDGCRDIEVIASDGRHRVTIVDSVQQIDLALLRVYGLRGGVASLRAKSATLLGESATVFGFPLGGALSSTGNFTTGVVSSLRGLRDAAGEIQITAPVQPGNSGGPVLDRSGAVIGVVQSKLDALKAVRATGDIPQNVNFAVSLDVLADFLKKNNVQFKSAERQPAIETTQVAEMAQSFTFRVICLGGARSATETRIQPVPPPNATLPPKPDKLVQDIQRALGQKGFNAGVADGFIGPQTQAAIIAAQRLMGLPANGRPSVELLAAIKAMAATKGTLQDAFAAYNNKDYSTALKIYREFALRGNANAQVTLGSMYLNGFGVSQDYAEALKWFRLSATQGNARGQALLGSLFLLAQPAISQDYAEALKWIRLSATQGNAIGQLWLGYMYATGSGVPKDYAEALRLLKLSASQGDENAKNFLEILTKQGVR